jgi:cation:H+ antiporter
MFESFPIWVNFAILLVAAVCVWIAGVRLESAVRAISTKTRLGTAFGGLVLLALATSLPELATTITGSVMGNAALVTNNLLGGVMLQTAVLAAADFALRRGALTYFAPQFTLLIGGVSLVMLLGVTLSVMAVGDHIAIAGIGLGTALIFAVHLTLVYISYRSGEHPGWQPTARKDREEAPSESKKEGDQEAEETPLRKAWLIFAICSLVIFAAGWLVMLSAEGLTKQTGIAASFIGATLVAFATSLPELSTTITAVRRGHNAMAISNIFGSNMWDVSLLFIADIFFRSGPLLGAAPRQAMFTGSLGLVMTCLYLWGLLERRNRTFWRAGIDSVANLLLYVGGLLVLYTMG